MIAFNKFPYFSTNHGPEVKTNEIKKTTLIKSYKMPRFYTKELIEIKSVNFTLLYFSSSDPQLQVPL